MNARALTGLLFGLCALLGPAAAAPMEPATAPGCAQGKAAGLWNLPATQPGQVQGVLVGGGAPVFGLDAVLLPSPGPGPLPSGVLGGLLLAPTFPGAPPQPVAFVQGNWVLGPNGVGFFDALMLQPAPTPLLPPRVLGRIAGRFGDDPRPTMIGGFEASWIVCP